MSGANIPTGEVPEKIRIDTSSPVAGSAPFARRHVLAISGGGYRGLFAAEALAHFEKSAPTRISQRFDLIAGTSIGAIIATGLVFGIPAREIAQHFCDRGRGIFRRRLISVCGLFGPKYNSDVLQDTIREILGAHAETPLSKIRDKTGCDLLITAVDKTLARYRSFCSFDATSNVSSDPTVLDACMASAAAPTFFRPHSVDSIRYVDGGLAANAPEIIAVNEARSHYSCARDDIYTMSVGTMGRKPVVAGQDVGGVGSLGWAFGHKLFPLIIGVQEDMTVQTARREFGAQNYLRLDYTSQRWIDLDDTSEQTRATLQENAREAVRDIETTHPALWDHFVRNTAGSLA